MEKVPARGEGDHTVLNKLVSMVSTVEKQKVFHGFEREIYESSHTCILHCFILCFCSLVQPKID